MKKHWFLLLMTVVLIFSLSACSLNNAEEKTEDTPSSVSGTVGIESDGQAASDEAGSSELYAVYQTLDTLNDTLSSLEDVEAEELEIPNP